MTSAEEVRIELEKVVKEKMSGMPLLTLVGFKVFMPLIVKVVTSQGVVSLTILGNGNVQLGKYVSARFDITIHASFETLISLLHSRDKNKFIRAEKEGKLRIISHTSKGQKAEGKLREFLGY